MTGNILEQGNPPRFMGEMVARLLAGMEALAEGRTHTGAVRSCRPAASVHVAGQRLRAREALSLFLCVLPCSLDIW